MSWRLGCTLSHRKGILHRYDLLSEGTWNPQWSTATGDNPGEHDLACEVLDYGVLSFDRSQCIEFLTRPAVAEGRHLKLRDHHHDTGGKERHISPTPSKIALINISIPIVHTATQSQVIEPQRNYLHPFPRRCVQRGLVYATSNAQQLEFTMNAQELIAATGSASIHVPWQVTASIFQLQAMYHICNADHSFGMCIIF